MGDPEVDQYHECPQQESECLKQAILRLSIFTIHTGAPVPQRRDGSIFHDKGKILDVNQQFVTLYGYDRDELIGVGVLEFIAPEDREIVLRHIQEGYEKVYEAVGLKIDGSTVHLKKQGASCFLFSS